MRIGVLDILALPSRCPADTLYHLIITRQMPSVTPQAISVWCRQLGHETFYATYYGVGNPRRLLPPDLDAVFIACSTQSSAMAYALGKIYRRARTQTIIGGAHAKAFPVDCLRFFDLVVYECDKNLVADILAGHFHPHSFISSAEPFDDLPTVEERMPEIRASAFLWGRWPSPLTVVPMLMSVGCPYHCEFCIDWNSPYRLLSRDRLAADLRYLAKYLPGTYMAFHDPNFAVKFSQVLDVLEAIPPDSRIPYFMESSLSILRGTRMKRLKDSSCFCVAPGIESWVRYSKKTGFGQARGLEKVNCVAEHFERLHENVPYLQANLIFGLDIDEGDDPVELTKEFMERTPFVWPTINIPVPFGGTPLYQRQMETGRILEAMPFSFYYAPYLVTTLKNYDPVDYYEKLIGLFSHSSSGDMLKRRMKSTSNWRVKLINWSRTLSTRSDITGYRRILEMLRSDPLFRAFHEGRSEVLPEFYHAEYERMLGPYAGLLSRAERVPDLEHVNPVLHG
jgi:hypothetical protein